MRHVIAFLSERENAVEQVNAICRRLFDKWWHTHSVTPLAYLKHCWPMIDSMPNALRRLGHTMRDLRRYHADQLDQDGFRALCELADLLDELIERPAHTGGLMAVGEAEAK